MNTKKHIKVEAFKHLLKKLETFVVEMRQEVIYILIARNNHKNDEKHFKTYLKIHIYYEGHHVSDIIFKIH